MSRQEEAQPKIGAGHASAMWRQGLAELRGALYNEGTVAQPTQYGIYGTKTPGEVAKDREGDGVAPTQDQTQGQSRDQEPASVVDQSVQRAQDRAAQRDPREHEGNRGRERE